MTAVRKVLFLCTGNSCRSQIAEAVTNARLGASWRAFSAGTHPAGYVHPMALRVLEEVGIHYEGRSKSVDEVSSINFDLVVTVCDQAAEECSLWLGSGRRVHIGFSDPAKVEGDEAEQLAAFRAVRDEIEVRILAWISATQ